VTRKHPDVDDVLVGGVSAGTVEAVLDNHPDAANIASATPDHRQNPCPANVALRALRIAVACNRSVAAGRAVGSMR